MFCLNVWCWDHIRWTIITRIRESAAWLRPEAYNINILYPFSSFVYIEMMLFSKRNYLIDHHLWRSTFVFFKQSLYHKSECFVILFLWLPYLYWSPITSLSGHHMSQMSFYCFFDKIAFTFCPKVFWPLSFLTQSSSPLSLSLSTSSRLTCFLFYFRLKDHQWRKRELWRNTLWSERLERDNTKEKEEEEKKKEENNHHLPDGPTPIRAVFYRFYTVS